MFTTADQQYMAQPGGGVISAATCWDQLQTPAAVRSNQLAATVKGYREQAIYDGIPFRWPLTLHFVAMASQTQALMHWRLTAEHLSRAPCDLVAFQLELL